MDTKKHNGRELSRSRYARFLPRRVCQTGRRTVRRTTDMDQRGRVCHGTWINRKGPGELVGTGHRHLFRRSAHRTPRNLSNTGSEKIRAGHRRGGKLLSRHNAFRPNEEDGVSSPQAAGGVVEHRVSHGRRRRAVGGSGGRKKGRAVPPSIHSTRWWPGAVKKKKKRKFGAAPAGAAGGGGRRGAARGRGGPGRPGGRGGPE